MNIVNIALRTTLNPNMALKLFFSQSLITTQIPPGGGALTEAARGTITHRTTGVYTESIYCIETLTGRYIGIGRCIQCEHEP